MYILGIKCAHLRGKNLHRKKNGIYFLNLDDAADVLRGLWD